MSSSYLESAFTFVNAADMKALAALSQIISFDPGTVLLEEGRSAHAIYLITDGVALVTSSVGGVEIVINELSDGALCGEVSFAGRCFATATVRASTRLTAIKLDCTTLMNCLDDNPTLGLGVYKSMALTLSQRLLRLTERFAYTQA